MCTYRATQPWLTSPRPDWLHFIRRLAATLISAPCDLADAACSNITRLIDTWAEKDSILHLWQAAEIATEPQRGRLTARPLTPNASLAALKCRAKDIDNSAPSNRSREMSGDLGPPAEFDMSVPVAQLKAHRRRLPRTPIRVIDFATHASLWILRTTPPIRPHAYRRGFTDFRLFAI